MAKITIIPGPEAQADEKAKERLSSFERQLVPDQFSVSELQKSFDEVGQDLMMTRFMLNIQRLPNAWEFRVRVLKI